MGNLDNSCDSSADASLPISEPPPNTDQPDVTDQTGAQWQNLLSLEAFKIIIWFFTPILWLLFNGPGSNDRSFYCTPSSRYIFWAGLFDSWVVVGPMVIFFKLLRISSYEEPLSEFEQRQQRILDLFLAIVPYISGVLSIFISEQSRTTQLLCKHWESSH